MAGDLGKPGRLKPSPGRLRRETSPGRWLTMDPHFDEYRAAVAGMQELYGEPGDEQVTDFHDDTVPAFPDAVAVEAAPGFHWDV